MHRCRPYSRSSPSTGPGGATGGIKCVRAGQGSRAANGAAQAGSSAPLVRSSERMDGCRVDTCNCRAAEEANGRPGQGGGGGGGEGHDECRRLPEELGGWRRRVVGAPEAQRWWCGGAMSLSCALGSSCLARRRRTACFIRWWYWRRIGWRMDRAWDRRGGRGRGTATDPVHRRQRRSGCRGRGGRQEARAGSHCAVSCIGAPLRSAPHSARRAAQGRVVVAAPGASASRTA